MPEFEDKEMPKLIGAITSSISVLHHTLPYSSFIQISPLNRPGLQKNLQKSGHRLLPEPMNKRHGESLLLSVKDLTRDTQTLRQFLQYVFGLSMT